MKDSELQEDIALSNNQMLAIQYCQIRRKDCLLASKTFHKRVERNLDVSERVYIGLLGLP